MITTSPVPECAALQEKLCMPECNQTPYPASTCLRSLKKSQHQCALHASPPLPASVPAPLPLTGALTIPATSTCAAATHPHAQPWPHYHMHYIALSHALHTYPIPAAPPACHCFCRIPLHLPASTTAAATHMRRPPQSLRPAPSIVHQGTLRLFHSPCTLHSHSLPLPFYTIHNHSFHVPCTLHSHPLIIMSYDHSTPIHSLHPA